MKKSLRKLSLSRETLRALDNTDLGHVAGAARSNGCPTQTAGNCEYTYSCPENCPSQHTTC
jgi:hypothetical protein